MESFQMASSNCGNDIFTNLVLQIGKRENLTFINSSVKIWDTVFTFICKNLIIVKNAGCLKLLNLTEGKEIEVCYVSQKWIILQRAKKPLILLPYFKAFDNCELNFRTLTAYCVENAQKYYHEEFSSILNDRNLQKITYLFTVWKINSKQDYVFGKKLTFFIK